MFECEIDAQGRRGIEPRDGVDDVVGIFVEGGADTRNGFNGEFGEVEKFQQAGGEGEELQIAEGRLGDKPQRHGGAEEVEVGERRASFLAPSPSQEEKAKNLILNE